MQIQLITTRRGKVLLRRGFHKISAYPDKALFSELNALTDFDSGPSGVFEVSGIPFFAKRRSFLFVYVWTLHECSPSMVLYHLKRGLVAYPWPVCVTSSEGKVLFVNSAMAQSLGYSSQSLVHTSFVDLFMAPPTQGPDFHTKVYQLKTAHHYTVGMTISHITTEGEYVLFFLFPSELDSSFKGGGDVRVLNHLPVPAALLDENGGIQQSNALLREKLSTKPFPTLAQWICEKDRYTLAQQLKRLRKAQSGVGSVTVHLKNQPHIPFLIFLKYIPGEYAQAPGQFLSVFTMESPLLPMKEADPHKMELLGQLASGIVHDFNNLLTGILGFCDLLLQRHVPEEASFKDIQQIKQSAMSAARLIQQLLAFSKSSPPSHSLICLKQCVQDLFPIMNRMVGPKILLSLQEKNSAKYIIQGDHSQVEQVLLNLAINARDAMVEGGDLVFALRIDTFKKKHPVMRGVLLPKTYVIVDVKDTGTGIQSQDLDRIFDPFFSTKDRMNGTGLGLSNVLHLMNQFQGGVTVDTQIGKGTTFSLYFPECKDSKMRVAGEKEALHVATPGAFNPIKILLVEDEDPIRLFAARALREKGHAVIEARDGAQALDLAHSCSDFDIVVTDVMMPGIDGPTLVTSIKALIPSIKVLFVSGYPEEEVRSHLPQEMQKVYFLPKPFALADLLNKVQELFPKEILSPSQ
jgi:two-component system cell cycle sensor histidine kinase/response regulator CckA